MIHLAVETSTEVVELALLKEEQILAQISVFRPGGASELLVPGLETLLEASGLTSDAIELVSSSAGPGTYTSIRVGHLFCKGLSYAMNLPHLTISPFLILAEKLVSVSGKEGEFLLILLDARRHEVNACLFDPARPAIPLSLDGPAGHVFSGRAVPPEGVLEALPSGKGWIAGPGVHHLPVNLRESRPDLVIVPARPEAETMGRLALRRWKSNPTPSSSGDSLLYGRDSVIA